MGGRFVRAFAELQWTAPSACDYHSSDLDGRVGADADARAIAVSGFGGTLGVAMKRRMPRPAVSMFVSTSMKRSRQPPPSCQLPIPPVQNSATLRSSAARARKQLVTS